MLINTESSVKPPTKLKPYTRGLIWGLQDIGRGAYSLDAAAHLATSASADVEVAGAIIVGYIDASDDSDEPRTWDGDGDAPRR